VVLNADEVEPAALGSVDLPQELRVALGCRVEENAAVHGIEEGCLGGWRMDWADSTQSMRQLASGSRCESVVG
jgi:hypothetical protein